VVEIAGDLVGLHGTDAASVFLAVWARMSAAESSAIEHAFYADRVVLRTLGMRRTMFVFPRDLAAVVHAACTKDIAARERRKLVQLLDGAGVSSDAERWLIEVENAILRALGARGEALASELSEDVPALRHQILFGEGRKWQGRQALSTRVLFLLAADARFVRGRPRGSWTSTQYRWALIDSWLHDGMVEWPPESARVELIRRWLAAFGPGTVADLKWWTGLTVAEVKRALKKIETVEVEIEGGPGLVLADDLKPAAVPDPWVALLPALDSSVMGWSQRQWYLGDHGPALFDRSGNAGPTVWCEGRIVGGWAHRKEGRVAFRLLEDVGREAASTIEETAERLGEWLGPIRVTPRFRTPLERELSA
jgi:hypothetical protein